MQGDDKHESAFHPEAEKIRARGSRSLLLLLLPLDCHPSAMLQFPIVVWRLFPGQARRQCLTLVAFSFGASK